MSRGRVGRRLSALPIRLRLVAGFVVAITIVLAGAGAFVYWRVSYALDLRLDNDLRADAAALAPLVTSEGPLRQDAGLQRIPASRLYQVLDGAGVVLAAGDQLGRTPVLKGRAAHAAVGREVLVDVGALLPRSRRPLRLIAVPVPGSGPARVLVVAQHRDQRDEALRELLAQLALAGAGALLVTAVVGERLAKAALAPVERYRAQAARIAAGHSGVRLDVPEDGRDDEVTRLGHTLNDVLAALELALARERRFTQDASHELRTPLTLLSTRVQLALSQPRSPVEHEAVLRELNQDIGALSALANELLTLSTANETADPTIAGCDLVAVARSAVLSLEVAPGLLTATVAMPEFQVRQVLGNLLDNARAHGHPPVGARLSVHDRLAVLVVSDGGPGIDRDFLPRAAERFARSAAARARPGAGLGLALVQTLVDRYGGELRLCSAGAHHRYVVRFDVPCTHPASGTSASLLLPLVG